MLIAEPLSLIRDAISALLVKEPDIEVVAGLGCESQIVPTTLALDPDVVIIDIDPEGGYALGIAGELLRRVPRSRTLFLTGLRRPEWLRQAMAVDNRGGILAKDALADDLLEGIRKIAEGRHFIDPELALTALTEPEKPCSERELEVLRLAADGKRIGEIASTLFLSPGTVRNYLSGVSRRLGARNRMDAIRIAAEAGWL